MSAEHVLGSRRRLTRHLARWVLAWFACSCLVAVAAPIFQPQGATLVCTAAGEVKWVAAGDTGSLSDTDPDTDAGSVPGHHTLDCVLCLPLLAPAAEPPAWLAPQPPVRTVLAANFLAVFPRPGYSKLAARGPPAPS